MLLNAAGTRLTGDNATLPLRPTTARTYADGLFSSTGAAQLTGFGYAVTGESLDNPTLAARHNLKVPEKDQARGTDFNEWVFARTGISSRFHVETAVPVSTFALDAARNALAESGVNPLEVDEIILGTTNDSNRSAGTVEFIRDQLGCPPKTTCTYVVKACASFVFCAQAATSRLNADSAARNILVVCADKNSSLINFSDVGTAVLFGDGAAATVISRKRRMDAHTPLLGIAADSIVTTEDDSLAHLLYIDPNGHLCMPAGPKVFANAVKAVKVSILDSLARVGIKVSDVDHFFLHQANVKLIQNVARDLDIPLTRIYSDIGSFGNTGAASPLLVASEAVKAGVARRGDIAVFAAVGMGMKWGAFVVVI